MDFTMDYLRNNPPACIAGFQLEPVQPQGQEANQLTTVFALGCKCCSKQGSVLGYPLGSVKTDYSGPETFVGPLAFSCFLCKRITEIIDTDVDGYHGALRRYLGESTLPVTIRGEGPRRAFQCPKCLSSLMNVTVEFHYSGAEQDIEKDEHTGHMEEFFAGFNIQGVCVDCGESSIIAEFVHL